jgi:hypothetical protein
VQPSRAALLPGITRKALPRERDKMSATQSELDMVNLAVKRLDYHGPGDWRAKIDLTTLDLGDVKKCVLGQIYGNYDVAEVIGFRNVTCGACPKWEDVEDAFNMRSYLDAWREVLAPESVVKAVVADATWYSKGATGETVTLLASYKHGAESRVVFAYPSGSRYDQSESAFAALWSKEKPVTYVRGGLYTPKTKAGSRITNSRVILLYIDDRKMQALAGAETGKTQHSPVKYWVEKFGELEPVKFCRTGGIKQSEHMKVELDA